MNNEKLRENIRGHLEVVLQKKEGNLADAIQSLDHLKGSTKGHLSHYLTNRSYQKAWILLSGGDPEKGICG